MKRLAVISDTHNLLRPQVLERLADADVILHAGDVSSPDTLEALRDLGRDLYLVRGNNDWSLDPRIPPTLTVSIEGVTFFLVHNQRDVPPGLSGVDVVVYGHSHRYAREERRGVLWLNPGSCGPRRFHQETTMAMAEARDGTLHVEKVVLPHEVT